MSSFNSKDLLESGLSEVLLSLMALTQGGLTLVSGVQNANCRPGSLSSSLGVAEPLTCEPQHDGEAISKNHDGSYLLHVETTLF